MSEKRKGWIQLIAVIIFIVVSIAVSMILQTSKRPPAQHEQEERVMLVETVRVAPAEDYITFDATGIVQSRTDINVVPQVSGKITWVNPNFYDGGYFKPGETLVRIEDADYRYALQQAQSTLAQAETALEQELAEGEASLSEWKLVHGNNPPPPLAANQIQIRQAEAALAAAKAQLEDANLDLQRTKISMPFNGRVLSSSVAAGQYITAGSAIASVFDVATLEVQSSLSRDKLKWLLSAEDPKVQAIIDSPIGTMTYPLSLKRGASNLNETTRFASVTFGFDKTDKNLLPGSFGTLKIRGPKMENITIIPSEALQKENILWRVDEENMIHRFQPNIIYSDGVSIIADNIDSEMRIVKGSVPGAVEGTKIDIVDTTQAEPN